MKLKPKKNLKLFNRKELDHIPTPAEIKAANDIYMAKMKELFQNLYFQLYEKTISKRNN